MTNEQCFIISLLRKSIGKGEILEFTNRINELEVERIIINNGILLTVYPVIKDLEYAENLKSRLKPQYLSIISQLVNQKHEGEQVLKALGYAGFDCIALKGWELQNLYPKPNMRQMVDIDILIRPFEYYKIKEIMNELGYFSGEESAWKHDSFRKGKINFEMHKRLTDDSGLIQQWETQMWNRAISVGDHIFRMTHEDFYIFHLIHMHKDFMNGSLGLRRIVDTWLLSKISKNNDYIDSILMKIDLCVFRERMEKLAQDVIVNDEMDANSEILLAHAFRHGIYGSDKSYKAGRITAMSMNGNMGRGKFNSIIAAIFLPINRMKAQYPVLEKYPILLPYCWGRRIKRFLNKDIKLYAHMIDYREITEEDYQEMRAFFKAGGIQK